MMKYIFSTITLFFIGINLLKAQELNCKVQVLAQRATATDQQVFKTLQTAIFEFMNNKKWTQDTYTGNEKIECTLFINITSDPGGNKFGADVTIQSSRPAFNASFNAVLLNYADANWNFEYVQFQPIIYTDGVYTDNLSSLLAFYAYVILGLDYDSYSLKGGSLYFQKAQEIVNFVPQNTEFSAGWQNTGVNQRNRYALIENILNPRFEVFRQINYDYHRISLDKMYDDVRTSRTQILSYLKKIDPIYTTNPNAMVLQMFFNAKSTELISLYSKASPTEKTELRNLLTKFDPVNSQKYEAMSK